MRGIVLAGGTGTRLHPLTIATSKQLLPVYDKPMIYYPISTLMLAGIREILVITTPHENEQFRRLLDDGSQWGIKICYETQPSPGGIAEALLLGEKFVADGPVALILGDNIFYGPGMGVSLDRMKNRPGATIFAYKVENPKQFAVVEFNLDGSVASLEEKPKQPKSDFIVPGLYFYDNRATELARRVKRSSRGELEITDLNKIYLELGQLRVEILGTENTWFDTGTIDSLHQAENQVFNIEKRRGLKINVPEEIAWRLGFISHQELYQLSKRYSKSGYGSYLQSLLTGTDSQQVREQ